MIKTDLKKEGGETKMGNENSNSEINLVEGLVAPTVGFSPSQTVEGLNLEVPGLGMTGRKLRKLIRKGSIEATKEGGRWVISLETFNLLLEIARSQMAARKALAAESEE